MPYSVSFWNVENFSGDASRSRDVEKHIRSLSDSQQHPDVLAFCEVKDKTLMRELISRHFPTHDFAMSDTAIIPKRGRKRSQIEILVGWRRDAFDQVMFTQRIELTSGRFSIRPGALLNVRRGNRWDSLLFLHTKSGPNTESYKVRQKQFKQVFRLKKKLDELASGQNDARFIALGDLNTMGNGSWGKPQKVSGDQEVRQLRNMARSNGMTMQFKEFADTFNQRETSKQKAFRSNLDHVLTSASVRLNRLGTTDAGDPFTVRVEGWNQLLDNTTKLHRFEDQLSDHSALYFEVR